MDQQNIRCIRVTIHLYSEILRNSKENDVIEKILVSHILVC